MALREQLVFMVDMATARRTMEDLCGVLQDLGIDYAHLQSSLEEVRQMETSCDIEVRIDGISDDDRVAWLPFKVDETKLVGR